MANDKHCDKCHYYRTICSTNGDRACHYLLWTDKKRPCGPGKECTVKISTETIRRKKGN
jgi:hypothetical protein